MKAFPILFVILFFAKIALGQDFVRKNFLQPELFPANLLFSDSDHDLDNAFFVLTRNFSNVLYTSGQPFKYQKVALDWILD